MDEKNLFDFYVKEINKQLDRYLPDDDSVLTKSMRYSLFAGGKRIRPVIALAFCAACGVDYKKAMPFACSLELIHTYSLIFDDLPCMDNDILRRGKATNHVVYGEGVALMAGSGLNCMGFDILINNDKEVFDLSDSQIAQGIKLLVKASGKDGIVMGQVLDMANNGQKELSLDEVEKIHKMKTSAMLEAAALMGCIAANADEGKKQAALAYAENIGLAFQIRDDILDVSGDKALLGKSIGKDKIEKKTTFVDVLGLDGAQKSVENYSAKALEYLSDFEDNDFLKYITNILCHRNY